jgi:hypothetical protein
MIQKSGEIRAPLAMDPHNWKIHVDLLYKGLHDATKQEMIFTKPRIFIGSSTEAIELPRKVGTAIEVAGMTPVVWDTGAFPVGSTLLERIDSFAASSRGTSALHAGRAFCEERSDRR